MTNLAKRKLGSRSGGGPIRELRSTEEDGRLLPQDWTDTSDSLSMARSGMQKKKKQTTVKLKPFSSNTRWRLDSEEESEKKTSGASHIYI